MAANHYSLHETILKVTDVSLTLGHTHILDKVNFEIRNIRRPDAIAGQVVGLLGPSGIGKTQLFRILAGLNKPDTGSVMIGDPPKPVERGMVGVVAQHYPLFAHRTILGNLLIAGERSGQPRDKVEARARELLERFRLEGHGGHYPSQISGGQRQRVAIAQQIMCSEQFLLMDEPFSGLDVVAIKRVENLISEVAHTNELNTIIIVTHDITAALEIADTIWLMGRDSDEEGKPKPGAKIKAEYNLMDLGLAWRDGVANDPAFIDLLREIRERFAML